eukprot:tig00001206_g7492.t1
MRLQPQNAAAPTKLFRQVTPLVSSALAAQQQPAKKRDSLEGAKPYRPRAGGSGSASDSEIVTPKTHGGSATGRDSLRKKDNGKIKASLSAQQLPWGTPSLAGPPMGERGGHTATVISHGGRQKLFVFGGGSFPKIFNDLIQLDLALNTWSLPSVTGGPPPARYAHSATACGSKIVIFGGFDGSHWFDDCWILDTLSMNWTRLATSGPHPAPRYAHTATLIGDNKLLVFGGCAKTEYFNDVWFLDLVSGSWTRANLAGDCPAPRAYHSATLNGGKLYLFGGRAGDHFFDDINCLDVATLRWSKVDCNPGSSFPATPIRKVGQASGEGPAARAYHTCVLWNYTLVVFGGFDGTNFYDDCWLFDCSQNKWVLAGVAPTTLCKHSSTAVNGQVLILGGYDGKAYLETMWSLECSYLDAALQPPSSANPAVSSRSRQADDSVESERRIAMTADRQLQDELGRLNGTIPLTGLSNTQLDEYERIFIDGIRRVAAARQENFRRELEARQEEARRLRREMEDKENSRQSAVMQFEAMQAESARLQADFKQRISQQADQICSFKGDIDSLRSENADLKQQLQALQSQIQRRQSLGGSSAGGAKQTRFGQVEIREYRRTLSGGGGVPDDTGPSVGLDWEWENESVHQLSPFERARQITRVTREEYMNRGFMPADERRRILLENGHKSTALEREIRDLHDLKIKRQESVESPSGILLLSQG